MILFIMYQSFESRSSVSLFLMMANRTLCEAVTNQCTLHVGVPQYFYLWVGYSTPYLIKVFHSEW